jgi:hypothetical protein
MAGDRGRLSYLPGTGLRLTSAQNTLLVPSVPAKFQKQISTYTSTFNVQAKLRHLVKRHRVVSSRPQSMRLLIYSTHLLRRVTMEQGVVKGM